MVSTGNTLTDIMIFYVPLGVAVLLGIIGLLRGARREAVVSLSIVLAALIVSVWASPWTSDLHDMFTGMGLLDTQTWLGLIVIVLIVLVAGYGLGSAVVARGPMSATMRMGGFLVGLANGAALSGWVLRNYYTALVANTGANQDTFNALSTNVISRSLIIWAGWFPLAVAFVAAIVALVGPFRKAQTVVATPAPQTDWKPSTAPAATPIAPTAAMPTSYTPQYSQPYQQQYGQQQYGQTPQQPQAQQYTPQYQQYPPQFGQQASPAPTPATQPAPYTQQGSTFYVPAAATQPSALVDDAPPTMPMPTSDAPRSTAVPSETLYLGGMAAASGAASSPATGASGSPMGMDAKATTSTSPKLGTPDTGPLGDSPAQPKSDAPAWAQPPDSSWLANPKPEDSTLVSRSEAPTLAYPVAGATGGTTSSSPSLSMTNCPRCGAMVPSDATFCVECGNRMK